VSEWQLVTVLVALAGLIATVAKPLISLNASITRLTQAVGTLEKNIGSLASRNSEAHQRLWERSETLDDRLSDHETRIRLIEKR